MESACGPSLNFLKFTITRNAFYLILRLCFTFYINLSSKIVTFKIVTFQKSFKKMKHFGSVIIIIIHTIIS